MNKIVSFIFKSYTNFAIAAVIAVLTGVFVGIGFKALKNNNEPTIQTQPNIPPPQIPQSQNVIPNLNNQPVNNAPTNTHSDNTPLPPEKDEHNKNDNLKKSDVVENSKENNPKNDIKGKNIKSDAKNGSDKGVSENKENKKEKMLAKKEDKVKEGSKKDEKEDKKEDKKENKVDNDDNLRFERYAVVCKINSECYITDGVRQYRKGDKVGRYTIDQITVNWVDVTDEKGNKKRIEL